MKGQRLQFSNFYNTSNEVKAMTLLLGIDVGTTNVKAVLFDLKGNEVKVAYRKNEPLYFKQSKIEQDMNVLWTKVLECMKEVVTKENASQIAGIGLTGQGDGCWLIDKEGNPVGNSILWNDGRSKNLVDEIIKDKDLYTKIYEHTGTQPNMGMPLVLLMWNLKYQKENLDRADKLIFAKDWIRYKLTGKIGLDKSDAGTSLLDIKTAAFDETLFDIAGLADYKHLISTVNDSYAIAGNLKDDLADEIGLPSGVPVGYGAIDVIATTLGVGAIFAGDICTILGTTCATNIVTDSIEPGQGDSRYEKHIIDNLYIDIKPTMSGTTNIDWMYENIADNLTYDEVDQAILDLKPVPGGVIYHPYISTSGERSPFYDSNARSSFFGLNTESKKMDMVKSIYEGIAFSIKDCLKFSDTNENSTIYLAGGGAASKAWKQIISDVTKLTVVESKGSEFAAKGAVMGLAVTLGIFESFKDASLNMCHAVEMYQPNQENAKEYDKFFELYYELRNNFKDMWKKRNDILLELEREE